MHNYLYILGTLHSSFYISEDVCSQWDQLVILETSRLSYRPDLIFNPWTPPPTALTGNYIAKYNFFHWKSLQCIHSLFSVTLLLSCCVHKIIGENGNPDYQSQSDPDQFKNCWSYRSARLIWSLITITYYQTGMLTDNSSTLKWTVVSYLSDIHNFNCSKLPSFDMTAFKYLAICSISHNFNKFKYACRFLNIKGNYLVSDASRG